MTEGRSTLPVSFRGFPPHPPHPHFIQCMRSQLCGCDSDDVHTTLVIKGVPGNTYTFVVRAVAVAVDDAGAGTGAGAGAGAATEFQCYLHKGGQDVEEDGPSEPVSGSGAGGADSAAAAARGAWIPFAALRYDRTRSFFFFRKALSRDIDTGGWSCLLHYPTSSDGQDGATLSVSSLAGLHSTIQCMLTAFRAVR